VKPCIVIAEIGNAHAQDFRRATRLLDAAKACNATWAKLQTYTPDELIKLRGDGKAPPPWDNMTMRELYGIAQTPLEWLPALFGYAEAIGLPLFSSVFGGESLDALEAVGCPMYKVASFERDAKELQDAVEKTGKPWMISRPDYPHAVIPTLYCPPNYPQTEIDLRVIKLGHFEGFSYHGTDWRVPASSVEFGAQIVECHFQLDAEPNPLESNVSLGEKDFAHMVEAIRRYEAIAA
jgi:pseudaminic acid synthase